MAKTCPLCGTTFPDSAIFCLHDGTSLRALEESEDLIDKTFCDRYVVTECLGQGGMGAVYLARDVRLPQKVAIKVLRQRTASDPALVARFRQEAEAASRINHDRVARVFDFGFMDDGRAYIVMEFADGKTLKETLDDGPIDAHDAASITLMIAEGLNAAHKLGILHRDLKPENVMILDDSNGGLRVKVLDFGIAKMLGANEGEVRTEAGFVIGTPLWMSPEQLLAEPLDARSDVYALGLLAFAMLTGQRAFTGGTRQAEMMAPLSAAPRTLQELMPSIAWPPALQSLFNRTFARAAADRPASALEFANEMSRIVNSAPATTTAPVRYPGPTLTSKSQLMLGGGVLALALIAGVFAVVRAKRNDTAGTQPPVTEPDAIAAGTRTPTPPTVPADADSGKVVAPASQQVASAPVPPVAQSGANAASNATSNSGTNTRPTNTRPAPRETTTAATPVAPRDNPGLSGDAATLKRLEDAFDALPSSLSDETKALRATQLIRDLDALKLTTPTDQGWALLYKGMAHTVLKDKTQACIAFNRAEKLRTSSALLNQSIEDWQVKLGCPI